MKKWLVPASRHLRALGFVIGALLPLTVAAARPAAAQKGTATLRAVVFDSTEMKFLAGARVAVLGTSAVGDTDDDGFIELHGIPAGSHWVSFFHGRLQALGVSAPSRQVTFTAGKVTEVELSVPSDRTLLMGWCMAEQSGPGQAALAGVVTDSVTGVPLPRAIVTVEGFPHREGDPEPLEVRTDEVGYYRICDVPAGRQVKVQPHFGQSAGRSEVLQLKSGGAQIRDLMLLLSAEGTLVGEVHDYESGQPLVGAEVSVAGTDARQLTDSAGAFVLDGLPPGRHLVTTKYLGYQEHTDSVTVFSQETVETQIRLSQQAIALEGLTVTARTRFGKTVRVAVDKRADIMDRDAIDKVLPRVQNFEQLLRGLNAPGLSIRQATMADATGMTVQGLCIEVSRRTGGSRTCNQAAVLINGVIVPNPEVFLLSLDPGSIDHIEILSAVDAQFQYGSSAGNGAVLIYTR